MDNIYGHPDWRDRLAETLVDLRALPLDDVRRDPAASGLVRLTNQIAIPADVLAELGFPRCASWRPLRGAAMRMKRC